MEDYSPTTKPNRTKLWIIISVIITAALVGGGVFWYTNSQANKDKDALQEQVNTLRDKLAAVPTATPLPSVTPSPSPTVTTRPSATATPAATPNDTEAMKTAAINYVQALSSYAGQKATATVRTTSGSNFGQVNVVITTANNTGGGVVILKKVNGAWVGIYSGTSEPSKDFGERYGLPAGWYSAT